MFDLVARLIGGAVSPLVDQVTAFGASLIRRLALFLVAALCAIVVIIALTIAFDLWIASLASPIVGALAVAGLYLAIAVAAVSLALRDGRKPASEASREEQEAESAVHATSESVDEFTAPILTILRSLGLRREQLAVLAGASLAKQLNPLPLVGIAIVAGFLIGRMWQGWDALLSSDLMASVLNVIVPGRRHEEGEPSDMAEPNEKAA